jgi:hypothetical protein
LAVIVSAGFLFATLAVLASINASQFIGLFSGAVLLAIIPSALVASITRWLVQSRRRKTGVQSLSPDAFAAYIVLFKLACLVAVCLLGTATLLSLVATNEWTAQLGRALGLILVSSVLIWLTLGVVRDVLWMLPRRS